MRVWLQSLVRQYIDRSAGTPGSFPDHCDGDTEWKDDDDDDADYYYYYKQ